MQIFSSSYLPPESVLMGDSYSKKRSELNPKIVTLIRNTFRIPPTHPERISGVVKLIYF